MQCNNSFAPFFLTFIALELLVPTNFKIVLPGLNLCGRWEYCRCKIMQSSWNKKGFDWKNNIIWLKLGIFCFQIPMYITLIEKKKSIEVSKWVLLKLHIICEGQKISEANRLVSYSSKSTNILFWFCPSFIGQNRKNTFALFLEEMKTLSSTSSWNSQFKIHGLICKWADRKL